MPRIERERGISGKSQLQAIHDGLLRSVVPRTRTFRTTDQWLDEWLRKRVVPGSPQQRGARRRDLGPTHRAHEAMRALTDAKVIPLARSLNLPTDKIAKAETTDRSD